MKKLLLKIIKFFGIINIYQSKNNAKIFFFKNLKLKEYYSIDEISSKKIKNYLKSRNLLNRFSEGNTLCTLKKGQLTIGLGWKNNNSSNWYISEVDKYFLLKNKIILFDFWMFKQYRKKGYYSKMLFLIKNEITKKKFIIYSLSTNKSSIKGILRAGFKLKKKISKFND